MPTPTSARKKLLSLSAMALAAACVAASTGAGRRAPGAVAGDDDRRRPDTPQYIGRFKGPTLRALAPRAPYFHNGFAASLDEVVAFYNTRFSIGFTVPEQRDLVAFLKAF